MKRSTIFSLMSSKTNFPVVQKLSGTAMMYVSINAFEALKSKNVINAKIEKPKKVLNRPTTMNLIN